MPTSRLQSERAKYRAKKHDLSLVRNPALEAVLHQDQEQDQDQVPGTRTSRSETGKDGVDFETGARPYRPYGPPRIECADDLGELLRCHRYGDLEPAPVPELPPLWRLAEERERKFYELLALRFGLRFADGIREPLPLATSELVREGIVASKKGASTLIHRFEDRGLIHAAEPLPPLGMPDGTRTFLPGR